MDIKHVLLSTLKNSKNKTNAIFVLDSLNLEGATKVSRSDFQVLLSMNRKKSKICRAAFQLCDREESSYFVIMSHVLLKCCCCCNEERRLIDVLKKVSSVRTHHSISNYLIYTHTYIQTQVLVKHSEEKVHKISTNDVLDLLRRTFNQAAEQYDDDKEELSVEFFEAIRRIFFELAKNADIKSGQNAMRSLCFALEPLLKVKLRVALSRLELAFSLVELDISCLIGSFVDGILLSCSSMSNDCS